MATLGACAPPPEPARLTAADSASIARIASDVAWLAAPARGGRAAGSPGNDSAAAYVARRYVALGIPGAFGGDYVQAFGSKGDRGHNVGAIITGRDASVANDVIIVGAHLDHIGRMSTMSLDPERGTMIHPGADDNASGTAAVLELARRLVASPPRRSVLLVHFDAEELGLLGSKAFVKSSPVPRARVKLMVNLDMVGRLRGNRVFVEIAQGGRAVETLVDSATRQTGVRTTPTYETEGRSDHASFAEWPVPALSLFTGFHEDYHAVTDTPARVNSAGIRRVVDVAEATVRLAANAR